MKKYLYVVLLILLVTGCGKNEKINYLETDWSLDDALKPTFIFDRSKEKEPYGIFYVDESQVKFEEFTAYLEVLEKNKFSTEWKYSDTDSIVKLKEEYEKNGEIFKDHYINYKMCNEEICFFMQWVNKEEYNKVNTDKPTSYSFKLETEKIK